ncbi:MAG: hypothetical protein V4582_13765 [Pseudomonadota bacterium]
MSNAAKIVINDTEYMASDLSADAKTQLANIQFVDSEIARLNAMLAVAGTARNAYIGALASALPKAEKPAAKAKKK